MAYFSLLNMYSQKVGKPFSHFAKCTSTAFSSGGASASMTRSACAEEIKPQRDPAAVTSWSSISSYGLGVHTNHPGFEIWKKLKKAMGFLKCHFDSIHHSCSDDPLHEGN